MADTVGGHAVMLRRTTHILLLLISSIALLCVAVPSARFDLAPRAREIIAPPVPEVASQENGQGATPSFADVAAAANPAVVNVAAFRGSP